MRERVPGYKLFIDCLSCRIGAYHFLGVDQRLNTFRRKECPGREACWLNCQGPSRYLIGMENSALIYVTTGHDGRQGVWSHDRGLVGSR